MKRLNGILTATGLVAVALALPLQTWAQQADAPDISGEWELTRQGLWEVSAISYQLSAISYQLSAS